MLIQTMNYATNTILDELADLPITTLNPGSIDNSASKMWFSNFDNYFTFARSYTKSAGDTVYYSFNFYTTNVLPANGLIDITLPVTPTSCWVSLGLEDIASGIIFIYILYSSLFSLSRHAGVL